MFAIKALEEYNSTKTAADSKEENEEVVVVTVVNDGDERVGKFLLTTEVEMKKLHVDALQKELDIEGLDVGGKSYNWLQACVRQCLILFLYSLL